MTDKTDMEKTKLFFDEMGIAYEIGPAECSREGVASIRLRIEAHGGGVKQDGYFGFFTDFEFDAEGKLVVMGIWE